MKAIDVMGFAGGFAAGVDQAGFDVIAKREPSEFKGFGVASHVYNMPWLDAQVSEPEAWDLPAEPVELLFGCPPCSGFSQLSFANTHIHGAVVGPDADINKCMTWLNEYAARVKPRVVVMESVGVAFKNGREWMEGRWRMLRERSGLDYRLWHVNMNAALVGGDVVRPRYFMVASLDPFGVGLDFVKPRSIRELLADLPAEEDPDVDWGHQTYKSGGSLRMERTMKMLRELGREWKEGTYLPPNVVGLEPPDYWIRKDGKRTQRLIDTMGPDAPPVYSHWYSTDPFATFRWRADRPYGVVVAAVLDRAVHPIHDRTLTWREAARFMSLPDDWSMRKLVEARSGAELGKAVPAASGKWVAHWAKMAIEGTPGEFAGVQDTDDPDIRVIQVQNEKQVEAARTLTGVRYEQPFADPDPATWIIDRKSRPESWWQNDTQVTVPSAQVYEERPKRTKRPQTAPVKATNGHIERVPPEVVAALLRDLGLTKQQAAEKLGVSASRVNELVTDRKPGSWLNAARWPEVQEALRV